MFAGGRGNSSSNMDQETSPGSSQHGLGVSRSRTGGWPWVILLLAGGAWGSTFSLARIATSENAHPLGINLWHAAIGAATLLLYNLLRRRRIPLGRDCLTFYAVAGLLGTVIPNTLFFYAASRVSAGVLSIALSIVPIVTLALAIGLRLDRFTPVRALGVFAGAGAILLLVLPEGSLAQPGAAMWVLVAILASGSYALENIYIALRFPRQLDAFSGLCGMQLMATLFLLPIAAATGSFVALPLSGWTAIEFSIVAMGLVNVVSYAAFIYLIAIGGPVFASQMAYVVTLSGVLWGIALFSETHSAWVWAALIVMLTGVALVKPVDARH